MTAILAALALSPLSSGNDARPSAPAEAVIRAAQSRAAREGKNVLVLFEASWCKWCRKFDALLADPTLRPAWQKSYVVAKINVREKGDLKRLENPGWEGVMKRIRQQTEVDVPYMAVLDSKGAKLADSLRFGNGPIPSNAGYPALPQEIDGFVGTVQRTGQFSPQELDLLKSRFVPAKS